MVQAANQDGEVKLSENAVVAIHETAMMTGDGTKEKSEGRTTTAAIGGGADVDLIYVEDRL